MLTFSDRLRTRRQVWWGESPLRHPLHRIVELTARRRRDDPDERWRCCEHWQRTLANKWNGREFAQRHGVRVPALYWFGRRTAALPVESLPPQFVIRPVHGAGGRGVHVVVGDRDLLGGTALPRAELRAALRGSLGRVARWPLLVEEFVSGEDGAQQLPTEYKCYTFGDTIGVIQVVYRTGRHRARQRFYTADWRPLEDQIQTDYPLAPPADPPRCLAEIQRCAVALGTAFGTFVRVDCFATPSGCVFGELSGTPANGNDFTPFADAYLGDLWQQRYPDRI